MVSSLVYSCVIIICTVQISQIKHIVLRVKPTRTYTSKPCVRLILIKYFSRLDKTHKAHIKGNTEQAEG